MTNDIKINETDFSRDDIENFNRIFNYLDGDEDNMLTEKEFIECLRISGFQVDNKMIKEIFHENDKNLYDINDFYNAAVKLKSIDFEEVLRESFKTLYGNEKAIDVESFNNYMTTLGDIISKDELNQFLYESLPESKGEIKVDDLIDFICGGNSKIY